MPKYDRGTVEKILLEELEPDDLIKVTQEDESNAKPERSFVARKERRRNISPPTEVTAAKKPGK